MAAPIYLYTGPEFGQRDEAVAAVKKSLEKKFGEIEEHLFYLVETPLNEIMTILQSGTLFSDGTFIVCKNAELLKDANSIAMISEWLKNPEENSAIVFVSDEISVDNKLDKLVPASNKKKFWEMFDSDKLPWLTGYFNKNGYKIEIEAAELILDMIENNTQALKAECERFFVIFQKDHTITCEDIERVLTHNREENAFTLFSEISYSGDSAQVRFEKGLTILQKIRLSKDNSSTMIIAGLVSCFRKLILWIDQGEAAIPQKMLQRQYRSAEKIWTKGQATAILAILASTDMEIRSGGSMMADVLLQKMLFEVIIKKGASMAVAEY
ncbi:MAG: DNA polymerase III subunit delta [Treponema sp.]|nr:DNA polymerase III subunit delta [Treponema sp.]